MMSRKTLQSGKPSHDFAFDRTQAGMNMRTVRFQAAGLPPIGTPQHAALVSDLRRAFPEIYTLAGGSETTE